MPDLLTLFVPPPWLLSLAVSAVWLYEGLWCKLLGRERNQLRVVEAVPFLAPRKAALFLKSLGVLEVGLGLWVLSGITPGLCALAQTVLLVLLNASGLLWARDRIHDPGGMVVKNFAFLLLAWVAADLARSAS